MDAADLAFAGLARHADMIRAGEVSSRELVDLFLERIERLDPQINSYRVVFAERARAEADQADGRRRAGDERPLLGVPIAIKDDCDVAGEVTAWGSNAAGGPPAADAEVVRRLRAAGAVILGKTHVPELTIVPFTESPTFGVTRNPWDRQRTPCGSSGGSGAAVAAGLASAALGSDGGGSIRFPAGACGLFGLKPQRGRVPTAPLAEPWHGLSIWGPLTRRVDDSARFYDAIRDGGSPFAEAAARPPGRLRIAVATNLPPGLIVKLDADQRQAIDGTTALLRELGHEVSERPLDYTPALISNVLARYLRGVHDSAKTVAHPERLSRRTRGYVRLGGAIPAAVVERAKQAAAADAEQLGRPFAEGFDVVMTPLFTHRPGPIGEYEGRSAMWTLNGNLRFVPFSGEYNHTGQPAAAVPAGFAADGFPLTVQLVGPPEGEGVLLSLAAQLEAAREWPEARPPGFG
jgi:amidase